MKERWPRDERVVELLVIEDDGPHAERRHEPVDRCEPVLPLADVGHDLEPPIGLSHANEQNAVMVAVDDVEGAHANRLVVVGFSRRPDPARRQRAARGPQESSQRLHRTRPVEDVSRAQCEIGGKFSRHALVDAAEFNPIDDPFVDRHGEHTLRLVERHLRAGERVAFILVVTLHRPRQPIGGGRQRRVDANVHRLEAFAVAQLFGAGDPNASNHRARRDRLG